VSAICSVAHTALAAEAKANKKTVVEDCDAGLLKICVPVFKEEEFVGVVGGCGLLSPDGEIDAFMVEKAAGLSEAQTAELAAEVRRLTPERIEEAVRWIEDRVAAIVAGQRG
jgi:ligand-binding sensor protein